MDTLLTAIYLGQVEGEPSGVGYFDIHCLLCDGIVEDSKKATVPGIIAAARHHAREKHDTDFAPVKLEGITAAQTQSAIASTMPGPGRE